MVQAGIQICTLYKMELQCLDFVIHSSVIYLYDDFKLCENAHKYNPRKIALARYLKASKHDFSYHWKA